MARERVSRHRRYPSPLEEPGAPASPPGGGLQTGIAAAGGRKEYSGPHVRDADPPDQRVRTEGASVMTLPNSCSQSPRWKSSHGDCRVRHSAHRSYRSSRIQFRPPRQLRVVRSGVATGRGICESRIRLAMTSLRERVVSSATRLRNRCPSAYAARCSRGTTLTDVHSATARRPARLRTSGSTSIVSFMAVDLPQA